MRWIKLTKNLSKNMLIPESKRNDKMDIRNLSFDNYHSIIELWEAAGLSHRPKGRDDPQNMKKEFTNNPDLILGAFEDDTLMGVIVGSDDGRRGWINRLAVHPDFRTRGIAKDLVAHLESALRKRGRRIICTLIDVPNDPSFGLFEGLGYVKHDNIIYLSKRESKEV
jgi:ribosomal protein S18 acetylase RimI-like enzyme